MPRIEAFEATFKAALKLSLGYPMNAKPGDYTQRFQFQLGTGF